jgi:hypothetical protein
MWNGGDVTFTRVNHHPHLAYDPVLFHISVSNSRRGIANRLTDFGLVIVKNNDLDEQLVIHTISISLLVLHFFLLVSSPIIMSLQESQARRTRTHLDTS